MVRKPGRWRKFRDPEPWRFRLPEQDRRIHEAIAGQFEDVRVSAGCIKAGKIRRDPLYVSIYLRWRFARVKPRFLARELGAKPGFVKFAIHRGRQLFEQSWLDGRTPMALARLGTDDEAAGSVK